MDCFFSDKEFIDEDMLYVLNTSKEHLLNGLKRQLMGARILRRNTQLQESVEQLKIAQGQLVQSEKMAVLGQLSAGVAHEINNPVSYVKSNLQVLQEYWQDIDHCQKSLIEKIENKDSISKEAFTESLADIDYDFIQEDGRDILNSALEGIERVKEIVADLKTFTHQGSKSFIATDIEECIESAAKMAASSISNTTKINTQIQESLPPIMANSGQIQQVFINLLVNADHAMQPKGGVITISGYQSENKLIFEVSDTGKGMDEQTVKKLFTPFFTTKPVGVGTGLGLSVSYAIIESHQATIGVNSVPDEGTTFIISFPIAS